MWVDVEIEKRDFRGAKRSHCYECPGARAINRKLCRKFRVRVYNGVRIYAVDPMDGTHHDIPIPRKLLRFMLEYDLSPPGSLPDPVSFRLNIPKRFLRSVS
jgi:hypothetical protein